MIRKKPTETQTQNISSSIKRGSTNGLETVLDEIALNEVSKMIKEGKIKAPKNKINISQDELRNIILEGINETFGTNSGTFEIETDEK